MLILYTVWFRMGSTSAGFKRVADCLYRYDGNGKYYAILLHQGKLLKRSLKTTDPPQAKRDLAKLRGELSRVDLKATRISLEGLCEDDLRTLNQAPRTIRDKRQIVEPIKRDWPHPAKARCQIRVYLLSRILRSRWTPPANA